MRRPSRTAIRFPRQARIFKARPDRSTRCVLRGGGRRASRASGTDCTGERALRLIVPPHPEWAGGAHRRRQGHRTGSLLRNSVIKPASSLAGPWGGRRHRVQRPQHHAPGRTCQMDGTSSTKQAVGRGGHRSGARSRPFERMRSRTAYGCGGLEPHGLRVGDQSRKELTRAFLWGPMPPWPGMTTTSRLTKDVPRRRRHAKRAVTGSARGQTCTRHGLPGAGRR